MDWLQEAYEEHTSEVDKKEVTRKPVFNPGTYTFEVKNITPKQVPAEKEDGTPTLTPNRRTVELGFLDVDGTSTAWGNITISPDPYKTYIDSDGKNSLCAPGHEAYTPSNKHDAKYRNWVSFENAVDVGNEGLSIGQVIDALDGFTFTAYAGLMFKNEDTNEFEFMDKGDDVEEWLKRSDVVPMNYFKSIKAV